MQSSDIAIFWYRVSDRELAKDLTQETFVKVWEYMVSGKVIEKLKPFLYRVATNLIIDNARKKARKGKELSPKEISEILEQSENAVSVRIHRVLKKLRKIIDENE